MNIEQTLLKIEKSNYGNDYNSNYLEQYKLYVEMADKISSRRQLANTFFLTVNTAIMTVVNYAPVGQVDVSQSSHWLVNIAGIVLCYVWYKLICSYKDLNSSKYKVIHFLEKKLPTAPYETEWKLLGEGKNPSLFQTFTYSEKVVPWIFLLLHTSVIIQKFSWNTIVC